MRRGESLDLRHRVEKTLDNAQWSLFVMCFFFCYLMGKDGGVIYLTESKFRYKKSLLTFLFACWISIKSSM